MPPIYGPPAGKGAANFRGWGGATPQLPRDIDPGLHLQGRGMSRGSVRLTALEDP